MSERITEDIVRSHFKNDSMFKTIKLEEQKPKNERIKELLKNASKRGTGKSGSPEFIITFSTIMNLVMIVECKSELKNHISKSSETNNPEKFAVDGALHYSKFLNNDFNVIAIAVSGQDKNKLKVSNFVIKKGEKKKEVDPKLLSIYDYISLIENENNLEKLKHENILLIASKLNDKLYHYSVPEHERATIVSGILIGLQNKVFRKSYENHSVPSDLAEDLLGAIKRVLKNKKMGTKIPTLMNQYNTILNSAILTQEATIRNHKTGEDEDNTLLRELIHDINTKVFPFTNFKEIGYDVLGQFYSEFIRYANGDKKLGLVLTPQHITELFTDIANLNQNDILYDNCCGTAGFLIKGMKKLFSLAGNDTIKKEKIKSTQIIGFERRPDMFTFACSNMMMRGDGRSNIFLGDSLSKKNIQKIKKYKPTVGFLNPPFAVPTPELEFIYHNLECLKVDGRCIALVPFNSILEDSGKDYEWKQKLLEKHTLEAVFSLPIQVFDPTGAVVAVVVFKAHNKHPEDYETYFGFWREDGFVKKKGMGRIDRDGKWESIKKDWLYNYRNRKEVRGQSVTKSVSVSDEWCAEAYMETDYSNITKEDFVKEIQDYVVFKTINGD